MTKPATDIAQRLASQAEAVCRHYLSQGRREGRYWLVGDARNTPGRSLYVRLAPSPDGRGAAGKWTDAATGDHGDLLDIIAAASGHQSLRDTLDEARRFLSLPMPEVPARVFPQRRTKASSGTPEAAGRLFRASRSTAGTIVEAYLRGRGLGDVSSTEALRFHPHCYYRPSPEDPPGTRTAWPAMIAAVTDDSGTLTGVHRTWLDPATMDKAPIATPRRAMGHLLGHGVRLGDAGAVMAAGEGIETMASLRSVLPALPVIAGLSAAHLAAISFPTMLRRLYAVRDDDPAGETAIQALAVRAADAGIEFIPLRAALGDLNDDLRVLGRARLRRELFRQFAADDAEHYFAASC
ncbi:MAG TPA: toprim domain-containing protein [Sphingomonas sp.]|nr:toprim domain-containing protein [Sphingomonas sp.]